MKTVSQKDIEAALQAVGIQPGDGLLVHSAIQFLGQPVDGLESYLRAIQAVIGPEGTLAVPTFNFAFARGEPYDPDDTPSEGMGVFSEYVRQQPEARRTQSPLQSLAVIGPRADDLASQDTAGAFDDGSAFDHMLTLEFKLLLLGADMQATSMVHYNEQRAEVPYRYWKTFTGQVKIDTGWVERTYRMYVRDLELDPQLELGVIQEALEARGLWQKEQLNYGWVGACRLTDFVAVVDDLLAADPWVLVKNK